MDSIYTRTGARLHDLRKASGLTQSDLAEKAGISLSFLSFLESGKRKGSLETYARLAQALGMGVDELFQDGSKKGKKKRGMEPNFGPITAAEAKAVYKLFKAIRKEKS